MPVSGGTPQLLGALDSNVILGTERGGRYGDVSPDGTAILMRTLDPDRWYVIANDRVARWPSTLGTIAEDPAGFPYPRATTGLWIGPHALLAHGPSGQLFSVDVATLVSTAFKSELRPGDLPLAHDRGRLLFARGSRVIVMDLLSGQQGDAGIDLGADPKGSFASALPTGGFILSTTSTTYRID
jgi:hypothetical protein